jgi:hypothetical protein
VAGGLADVWLVGSIVEVRAGHDGLPNHEPAGH